MTSRPPKRSPKTIVEVVAAALVAVSLVVVALIASRHVGRSEALKRSGGLPVVTNTLDAAPDAAADASRKR